MGEEKPKELKLVDVSFGASIKFWLAFLVVQIIVMVVVFGIMFVYMIVLFSTIGEIIPTPYAFATAVLSQLI